MGIACCSVSLFSSWTPSDWIDLIGVVVNVVFGFWIVMTIQNKVTNRRILKDHFISEIKEIRTEYKNCLSNLYSNNTRPHLVLPWFKLMNIKIDDMMEILHKKYKVDKSILKPYQIDLRELITNNTDFINQFSSEKVTFSDSSRGQFIVFQQANNHLFNDLIIKINDAS